MLTSLALCHQRNSVVTAHTVYRAQRHYTEERVHAQAVQDKSAKQSEVYLYIKPISYTFLVSLSYEYKSICRLRIFTARLIMSLELLSLKYGIY
jgi:hypothetical protein